VIFNRIVPVLLLHEGMLVKTTKFKNPRYVGDPINAVRIFNEKEVDELVVLDMDPCRGDGGVNMSMIEEIVSEAFMPVAYGGGVESLQTARSLVSLGIEKVVLNSAWHRQPDLVPQLAAVLGSQAVVGGIDVARRRLRDAVMTQGGSRSTGLSPTTAARGLVAGGVGEIFLNNIDRDGTMTGFDLTLIRETAEAVSVPLLACGGAGGLGDLREALAAGASAVGASSMFVFHGKHRAVLITYPDRADVISVVESTPAG
jgi:cyclase